MKKESREPVKARRRFVRVCLAPVVERRMMDERR